MKLICRLATRPDIPRSAATGASSKYTTAAPADRAGMVVTVPTMFPCPGAVAAGAAPELSGAGATALPGSGGAPEPVGAVSPCAPSAVAGWADVAPPAATAVVGYFGGSPSHATSASTAPMPASV